MINGMWKDNDFRSVVTNVNAERVTVATALFAKTSTNVKKTLITVTNSLTVRTPLVVTAVNVALDSLVMASCVWVSARRRRLWVDVFAPV